MREFATDLNTPELLEYAVDLMHRAIHSAEPLTSDGKTYGLRWRADDSLGQEAVAEINWRARFLASVTPTGSALELDRAIGGKGSI